MLLEVVLTLLALVASGTVRADTQLQPHGGGFMVPLQQREHKPTWRRHLLRSGYLPVQGAVREVGYFYTTLKLGTPARTFTVIIDTGSTITYIPCKGCAHCGKHTDEWFDPDQSTTAKKLGCSDPLCNCGTPSCSCNNDRCYYSRSYAERSSSEGWMLEDTFGFPDSQPAVRMVFGCENGETGEIYRQMADGIMGMGNNHNAFQSQLVQRGVIEDVFSLCFGYPKDGILLLGDVAMPDGATTVYTPLLTNLHLHYYNVKMDGITVDGVKLQLDMTKFDRGYGVVLDSGTTFTYLPTDAFNTMAKAIGDYAEKKGLTRTPGADPQYNDICWKGAADGFKDLEKFFPNAEFVFGGNAKLSLPPLRYLFLSKPAEYCLGFFDNGGAGTLIGGISVRDVTVTYDRRNSKVGFTTMACADVGRALAERGTAVANTTLVKIASPPPPPPPKKASSPPPPPPPKKASSPPPSPPKKESPPPPPPPKVVPAPSPSPAPKPTPVPTPASKPDAKPAPKAGGATPDGDYDNEEGDYEDEGEQGEQKGGTDPTGKPVEDYEGDEFEDSDTTTTGNPTKTQQEKQQQEQAQQEHPAAKPTSKGTAPSPSSPTPTGTPYHAKVLDKDSNWGGYGTVIAVVVVIGLVIVAAELFVFRRQKVRMWLASMQQRMRGAQDETELAPLAGNGFRTTSRV